MLSTPGIRVSFAGFVLFLLSASLLLFLPDVVSVPGMLIGGMTVWFGFMMTLFSMHSADASSEDEAPDSRSN